MKFGCVTDTRCKQKWAVIVARLCYPIHLLLSIIHLFTHAQRFLDKFETFVTGVHRHEITAHHLSLNLSLHFRKDTYPYKFSWCT
jgi:hypothetical protein